MTNTEQTIRALATDDHYPAVLKLFEGAPRGRILDVPAGHGAFAQELLKFGYSDIHCLDINAESFSLKDERVHFQQHDVLNPLPCQDVYFDHVLSIEGIKHFHNSWAFTKKLYRVLKSGGRVCISTPNVFSEGARNKWLVSCYFGCFKRLLQQPSRVVENWIAAIIRSNIKKRRFPDSGVSSEEMLFGDCIIIEGKKAA